MVSAWSKEHRLVLGQTKVSAKSNEITAISALLEMLDKSCCIITIDAMGTQKSIAQKIIEADSDYILSLKDHHPTLHQEVKNWFERDPNKIGSAIRQQCSIENSVHWTCLCDI